MGLKPDGANLGHRKIFATRVPLAIVNSTILDHGSDNEPRRLDDAKLKDLQKLIRRSFRVGENHTPIYVDVADNLERVALDQHQIVFGRRGSGKSCLLIFFRREVAPKEKVHTVYISGDTIKTLDYPDVLIRLLLAIFEALPSQRWSARLRRKLRRTRSQTDEITAELRELLHRPVTSALKVTTSESSSDTAGARVGASGPVEAAITSESATGTSREEVRESDDAKIHIVDRRLNDYKQAIQDEFTAAKCKFGAFIVDDFYLINPAVQPDVIDYLHRLLRDTDLYLKIGTVRYRTRLLRTTPIHTGVQVNLDVDGFNLDQTLEDIDQTGAYLEEMLRKLGEEVKVDDAPSIMSDEARNDAVLLSGGVPRDYLNIFVGGLERARMRKDRKRVTPTELRQAAAALSQETKFRDLRMDAGAEVPALGGCSSTS